MRRFIQLFFQPRHALITLWIRVVILGYLFVKVLSRDFSLFALARSSVTNFYPTDQYPWTAGYSLLGFQPIVDLTTFHWLHWFLGMPSVPALQLIQVFVAAILAVTLVFGRGPQSIFAILSYAGLMYLWGYVFRTGAELDGIFPHLQIVLAYCFSRGPEYSLTQWHIPSPRRRAHGVFYSWVVLIIAASYFYAGLNKLVDIPISGWFKFHLVGTIENIGRLSDLGFFYSTPSALRFLKDFSILNFIAVPLVYAMELTAPIIFFRPKLIVPYALFFWAFHLTTWSLIAFFHGFLILWLIFIPVKLLGHQRKLRKASVIN